MRGTKISAMQAVADRRRDRGIIEVDEWGDYKAGEIVGIDREAGAFTVISFRLTVDETECRWVNLIGGKSGRSLCRAVPYEHLTRTIRKRGKRK